MFEDKTYTLNDLVDEWGVSYGTIRRWINERGLVAHKDGRVFIVKYKDAMLFAYEYASVANYEIRKVMQEWYQTNLELEENARKRAELEAKILNGQIVSETVQSLEYNLEACKAAVRRFEGYIARQEELISQLREYL
jgi:hypothetical protein